MKRYSKLLFSFFSDEVIRFNLFHKKRKSDTIDIETRMWRCFLWLKHQYGQFLKSLPEYSFSSDVQTPKIIWWSWLQGEDNAPPISKACLRSLRKELSGFDIRIVTKDNINDLVEIPALINEKHEAGIISNAHYSDILRTMLLVKHGGTWIDSTVYCTGYHEPLFDNPFFVFQNWKFNQQHASICSSWLISSIPEHPILKTTLALLFEYWKTQDHLLDYYTFHLFFHMAADKYPTLWKSIPRYSNIPPHIMQFELFNPFDEKRFKQLCAMSDFHKLDWKAPKLKGNISGTLCQFIYEQ